MESQEEKRSTGSRGRSTTNGSGTAKRSYAEGRTGDTGSGDKILSQLQNNKTGLLGLLGAVAGGALLYMGVKGKFKGSGTGSKSITATSKVTVNQSREELYAYWRNLENLPNFMSHIKEVKETGDKRSTWTAEIPGGLGTIEWDAEIIQERKNHLLMWRSLPGSEIENAGEVRFEIDPKGKGTIVETTITYSPPAGDAGKYAAKLLNPAFEKTVKTDLKQFKKFMEKGGAPKRKSTPKSV